MVFPVVNIQSKSCYEFIKNANEVAVSVSKHSSEFYGQLPFIIFNQSVAEGTFPARLKTAKVTPILKSGAKDNPKNYRPISNLATFSKIIGWIMKK